MKEQISIVTICILVFLLSIIPTNLFAQISETIEPFNKKLGCLSVQFGQAEVETYLVRLDNSERGYSKVLPFTQALKQRRKKRRSLRSSIAQSRTQSDSSRVSKLKKRAAKLGQLSNKIKECRDSSTDLGGGSGGQGGGGSAGGGSQSGGSEGGGSGSGGNESGGGSGGQGSGGGPLGGGSGAQPANDACGVIGDSNADEPVQRIVNGDKCEIGNSPAVALIITMTDSTQSLCTGTVISKRAVLTAAHCFPSNAQFLQVIAGGNTAVQAQSVRVHPSFDGSLNPNDRFGTADDVAVVLMAEDLPTRIAKIVSNAPVDGERLLIAGYGVIDPNNDGTADGSFDGLQAGFTTLSVVTTEQLAAAFNFSQGDSNICSGDSGGGAYVWRSGEWVLAGINSYVATGVAGVDLSECGPLTFSGFMNVRDPGVRDFILQHVPGVF